MPADLRAHLRVPEELFNVQTRVFGRYHVTDPLQFFREDDLWTVPDRARRASRRCRPRPTTSMMRMPGETGVEFLLLQPMVPISRPNMIAWVAARKDAPNYGATRVYRFPADTTIFGPAQIEARIDQDPIISAQISLWNQSGSKVIRGNLIVLPLGDALIYLQPVYLQSTGSAFPAFTRIVVGVAAPGRLGATLGDALRLLWRPRRRAPPGPRRRRRRDRPPPGRRSRRRRAGPVGDASADAGGRPADRRAGPDRVRQHSTSSWPRRRSATATSPATARRSPSSSAALQRLQVLAPGLALPSVGAVGQPRAVNRGAALIGALLVTLADAGHLAARARRRSCSAAASSSSSCRSSCCRRRSGSPTCSDRSSRAIALGSVTGSMVAAGGAASSSRSWRCCSAVPGWPPRSRPRRSGSSHWTRISPRAGPRVSCPLVAEPRSGSSSPGWSRSCP